MLGEAVPKAGPAVLISFLIAGIAAGLSALCYAELASAIPVSGSTYSYAYHALGEFVAVIIAGCVVLEYGVSTGAVAVGWSSYFNELLHETIGWQLPEALSVSPIPVPVEGADGLITYPATGGLINLPAVVLVILCMLLLIRGASESATVNAIMVLIKLGVLVLFTIIGFSAFNADHFSNFFAQAAGISAAAGTIFFSFIGLDAVATAGEEVKNPQKALPIYEKLLAGKPVDEDYINAGYARWIAGDVVGAHETFGRYPNTPHIMDEFEKDRELLQRNGISHTDLTLMADAVKEGL